MTSVLMLLLLLGQCSEVAYVYKLDTLPANTRFNATICYSDGKMRTIPVIDGYVPAITFYSDKLVFDYTPRYTYENSMRKLKELKSTPKLETIPKKLSPFDPLLQVPSEIGEPRIKISPSYRKER